MLQGENKAGEGCGEWLKGEVSGAQVRGGLLEAEGREEEPRELREVFQAERPAVQMHLNAQKGRQLSF